MTRSRPCSPTGSGRYRIGVGLLTVLGLVVAATAHGDDRATAEALLAPLEHDDAHKSITVDAVKQARDALERATRMRDANDEARARLAETLGREWAQVARDLVRASDAEQAATQARLAADDAGARAERERSLLEEAIARQGRLRAELDGLEKAKLGPDRTASVGATPAAPKSSGLDGGTAGTGRARGRGVDGGTGSVDGGGLLP